MIITAWREVETKPMEVEIVPVRQTDLKEVAELERDVAAKTRRISELKDNIKVLLIHKMPVELGRFDARLIQRHVRNPPWKQCAVKNLGLDFALEFQKQFPVHHFCEVRVEE